MFEVERYLRHKASKFVYDANCYISLSHCMDLMDLSRGFKSLHDGIKRIRSKTLLVGKNIYIISLITGFEKDILIPVREMYTLYDMLKEHKTDVTFEVHPSVYGHDSFLIEYDWLGPLVKRFLES